MTTPLGSKTVTSRKKGTLEACNYIRKGFLALLTICEVFKARDMASNGKNKATIAHFQLNKNITEYNNH